MLDITRARELCDFINKEIKQFNLELIVNSSIPSLVDRILNKKDRYVINFNHKLDKQTNESLLVKSFLSYDMKLTKAFSASLSSNGNERKIARIIFRGYLQVLQEEDGLNFEKFIFSLKYSNSELFDKEMIDIFTQIKNKKTEKIIMKELPFLKGVVNCNNFVESIVDDKEMLISCNELLNKVSTYDRYFFQWSIFNVLLKNKSEEESLSVLRELNSFKIFMKTMENIKVNENELIIKCSSKMTLNKVKEAYVLFGELPYVKHLSMKIKNDVVKISYKNFSNSNLMRLVFIELMFNKQIDMNILRAKVMSSVLSNNETKKIKAKI